jgi:hypothetical protein
MAARARRNTAAPRHNSRGLGRHGETSPVLPGAVQAAIRTAGVFCRMNMRRPSFATALLMAAFTHGCAPPPPTPHAVVATSCPHLPQPPAAVVAAAPVSGFPQLLQPGHWAWNGQGYDWQPSQWRTWLRRTRPLWQPPYWDQQSGACIWHPAHFIYAASPAGP